MKPINRAEEGCTPLSSNCIIWQGRDIECVDLCRGDSISDVTYKMALKLCEILDTLNISNYDLSCLDVQNCAPTDFKALVELLINRICALEGIDPPSPSAASGCPNCMVSLATCFQYNSQTNGDLVTELLLADYVQLIGIQVCTLLSGVGTQGRTLVNHESRIRGLEDAAVPTFVLPNITPICVLPAEPTPLDAVVIALEQQFCELRAATGTPTNIYQAVANQCAGLNSAPSLGTHGGTMSSFTGWKSSVGSFADAFVNMWITICDLRSAVTNIKANCCLSGCDGVGIAMTATLPSVNTLQLFFTGTIPAELTQCSGAGTLFTISDQSGNSINVTFDLIANMNNPSGYPVTLTATPINTADNLTITSSVCLRDASIGTTCQSILSHTLINTAACPDVIFISGLTSINYSFTHTSGTVTYTVSLYDSTGNTQLQAQTTSVTNPVTVSGTFSGLSMGTVYKVRVTMATTTLTVPCPLTTVTTLANPCPPPQTVTAVITIP